MNLTRSCCFYAESDCHLKLFFDGFFMTGTNKASLSSSGAGRYMYFYSYFVTTDWQRLLFSATSKSYWKTVRKVMHSVQKHYWNTFAISFILYIKKTFELFIKDIGLAIDRSHQIGFKMYDHRFYIYMYRWIDR